MEIKNYVIADLKLFDNDQREKLGFSNFEIMNDTIIKSWNGIVFPDDKVLIMGEIGKGSIEEMKSIISQLNGELYYSSNSIDEQYTREQLKEMGISFTWSVSMYKEIGGEEKPIIYCISPIRHIKIYEENFLLIVVDSTNPIEGIVKGKMLSADAAKWYYSPIDTDNLLNIYENMKNFDAMENEEHRTDIKEE